MLQSMDLQELYNWVTDTSQTDRKDLARLGFDRWKKKSDRNTIPPLSKLLWKWCLGSLFFVIYILGMPDEADTPIS